MLIPAKIVYPFFSSLYPVTPADLNIIGFVIDSIGLFLFSPDPVSPVYLVFLPLTVLIYKKLKPEIKIIAIYSLLSLIIWYFTPRTGGGRFILPYLPAFSILCAGTLSALMQSKKSLNYISGLLISLIMFTALITVSYRFLANYKYLPVIIGVESKAQFLSKNLNFYFGDFYDIDGYFEENISSKDRVLLFGYHNLYYTSFNFIHSTWMIDKDEFNYVSVQNGNIPENFRNWELIYENPKTLVKLYRRPIQHENY